VRLTSFTDYGLRMLMRMASAPDRAFSTADLAQEFGLPRNHLSKIMQRLSREGIVETRRGGGGGAMLSRPPQDIRLGEVVRLLEADQPLVECLGVAPNGCTIDGQCRLKSQLRLAEMAFLAQLDSSSLADVALAAKA
jgi:Rrf2 family nitric oxide-sensitive transcriptional repressor